MFEWVNGITTSHLVPLHIYRLENFLFFIVVAWYFWNHFQMKKLLDELKTKRARKAVKGATIKV